MRPRDRKNLYALLIGLAASGVTWLAAQLEPGQLLCIEKNTLAMIAGLMAIAARILGWAVGREKA